MCPSFTYQLFADGSYVFNGRSFTAVQGEQRGSVPVERFAQALRLLEEQDFASVRIGPCSGRRTDMATIIVTVKAETFAKRVENSHSCVGHPDEARLEFIERELDRILQLEEWRDQSPEAIQREARRRAAG